ncbi:MAG: tetratricopeptide repeat protein, partial [Oscillospiraceae bacterium]|nr:tetratricopeptide repeat protein [Oscillospiraceae bacterium]
GFCKAYELILNKNTQAAPTGAPSYGAGRTNGAASFQNVRILISQSRISEAIAMLESLPRTAEWYYLSGRARMQVGWYDQAISFLQTAVNMDPDNIEYRDALENIKNRNRTYTTYTSSSGNAGCCNPLGCCTACMLADCICPCF